MNKNSKHSWIPRVSISLSVLSNLIMLGSVLVMYQLLAEVRIDENSNTSAIATGLISLISIAIFAFLGMVVSIILGVIGVNKIENHKKISKYSIGLSGITVLSILCLVTIEYLI